jgi:hypothetical protein
MYAIKPEFKTFVPEYAPNFVENEETDAEAGLVETAEVETKVVKPRGRRPRPVATEAETKELAQAVKAAAEEDDEDE